MPERGVPRRAAVLAVAVVLALALVTAGCRAPEEQAVELSVDLPLPSGPDRQRGSLVHHPSVDGTSVFYLGQDGDLICLSATLPPQVIRPDTDTYFWERAVSDPETFGDYLVCVARDSGSCATELWLLGSRSSIRIVSYGGPAHAMNLNTVGRSGLKVVVSRGAFGPPKPDGPQDSEYFLDILTLPESWLRQGQSPGP
jgi:hypothetical protein